MSVAPFLPPRLPSSPGTATLRHLVMSNGVIPANLGMMLSAPLPLYIGFATNKSWLAGAIEWFSGSDVDHAMFLWRDPQLGVLTLGANANGLTVGSLKEYLAAGNEIPYVFTAADLWTGLAKYFDEWINRPYDYAGLLGMSWVETIYWVTGRYVMNPLSARRKIFCSAFAAMVERVPYPAVLAGESERSIDPGALKQWDLQDAAFYRKALSDI
jgi:hypothetical protein